MLRALACLWALEAVSPLAAEEPAGVVVVQVAPDSAAARAGIRPGDIIEAWSRAAAPPANPRSVQGRIESPFDLEGVDLEEAPRGPVTLTGRRGEQRQEWELPAPPLGLTVRPPLEASLLALYEDGMRLAQSAEEGAAAERWRASLASAGGSDPRWSRVWLWWSVAKAWGKAAMWKDADAAYQEAVREADPAAHPARLAQILRDWGLALRNRSQWDQAEEHFREALKLDQAVASESLAVVHDISGLANTDWYRGRLDAGAASLQQALALAEKLAPGSLVVSAILNNLGASALKRGDLPAAEGHLRAALAIAEKRAPDLKLAAALNNLAVLVGTRGDLSAEEALHRRALAIKEKLAPQSLDTAYSLDNLGTVAGARGDLASAEEYHRRALAMREKLAPGGSDVAASLSNLGQAAWQRGDLAAAEEYYQRAFAINEKVAPDSLDLAMDLNNLGAVALERGATARAEGYHQRSLAIKQKLAPGTLDVADSLISLGLLAQARGDLAAAEDHFRRALAIREGVSPEGLPAAESLYFLGNVASLRGDLVAAEDQLRRAVAIREKLAPGSAHEAQSLHDLALVQSRKGSPAEAVDLHLRALAALERQRTKLGGTEEGRAGFQVTWSRYYHDTLEAQVGLGRTAEAFHVLERSRARSLLALLAERDLLFTSDLPADIARQRRLTDGEYDRIQAQLGQLDRAKDAEEIEKLLGQLGDIRREQEEIAQKIRRSSPRLASLQYPEPLDLPGARAVLDPGTALLAYSVGQDRTILFVVQPPEVPGTGLSVLTLPVGEAALRAKVEAFRTRIQRPAARHHEGIGAQGAALYELLLRPAETLLAGSRRLLLSPDGPLHSLPFAALVRRETAPQPGPRRFLVEWKPLSLVASATVYAELKRRGRAPAPTAPEGAVLVAFGDPRYPPGSRPEAAAAGNPVVRSAVARGLSFLPLAGSRAEVQAIAGLFAGSMRSYLGDQATEERAKTVGPEARYVHFACHAFLDERFPLNSGLALTIPERPAEGADNGLLQAWEIFDQVRLEADLVALSACGTGLGKEMGGEGLLGLVRAFHYAGARAVLASLWSVSDTSTADLMKRFYRHLRSGKAADEALRLAQLEMIRPPAPGAAGRSQPRHWAAFQLSGRAQ
ncbi:MAG TPA: CHAT domain-containing protein [Vicinamibacteria bacterium]